MLYGIHKIRWTIIIFFYLCFQEHDNEAETVISSLANNYDDDELDIGKQTFPSEILVWM